MLEGLLLMLGRFPVMVPTPTLAWGVLEAGDILLLISGVTSVLVLMKESSSGINSVLPAKVAYHDLFFYLPSGFL